MSVVRKPRRLVPVSAPAGIVCLLAAMVLLGMWTRVPAAWTSAFLLIACGSCCLGPVRADPGVRHIEYEEPTR